MRQRVLIAILVALVVMFVAYVLPGLGIRWILLEDIISRANNIYALAVPIASTHGR
jgi:hypothetical protein